MSSAASELYEFASCRLDVAQRVFTRQGHAVPLAPKTFQLLLLLVRSHGRAVSKHELMTALWPDTFVEEANLSFQISALRKALGDDSGLIETVPKHGYRFAAEVRAVAPVVLLTPPLENAGPSVIVPTARAAIRKWVVALVGASVLLAASYLVFFKRPQAATGTPASVAVPLTAYPGFETAPSLSPDGSQVAFVWDGPNEDNRDIYVKLVGPGEPLRLTTDPRWDDGPAWSPDGRLIAFRRVMEGGTTAILVIPALGGAERMVATFNAGDRLPAWTPDGKWIAVGGRPDHETSTGIWLIGLDGLERRRLTDAADVDVGDTTPRFSFDGRYVAFIRARQRGQYAVYVLELSSSLTPVSLPIRVTMESPAMRGLAWSPNSKSLVFSSGAHVAGTWLQKIAFTATESAQPAQPEILPFGERASAVTTARTGRLVYAAHSRDVALWQLSLTASTNAVGPTPVAASTYDEHTPDYSPDGKRLAFTSNRSGAEEIWIADADGSNPKQMTAMKGPLCANPRWSPDGRTILFTSRREGSQDLYLLSPDTGEVRRLTDHPSEETEPRWSRDGRSIYFGSPRAGRRDVWKMSAAGGPAVRITQHGGMTATESLDGRVLYYAKQGAGPTSIWQVPVDGGEEKLVVDGLSNSLNFAVADRGLYFLAAGDSTFRPPSQVLNRVRQPTSIDFFEFATAKRTTLFVVGKQAWVGMALSPDQRSLLYSVIDSAGSNLMLIERFQ